MSKLCKYKSDCKLCGHKEKDHVLSGFIFNKKVSCISIFPSNYNKSSTYDKLVILAYTHPGLVSQCGCKNYIPEDNLEYFDYKYEKINH